MLTMHVTDRAQARQGWRSPYQRVSLAFKFGWTRIHALKSLQLASFFTMSIIGT